MKPTGFIEQKQISKQPENRDFKRGDWVVLGHAPLDKIGRVGVVDNNGGVGWIDGCSYWDYDTVNSEVNLRHITTQELALFNLKAE